MAAVAAPVSWPARRRQSSGACWVIGGRCGVGGAWLRNVLVAALPSAGPSGLLLFFSLSRAQGHSYEATVRRPDVTCGQNLFESAS